LFFARKSPWTSLTHGQNYPISSPHPKKTYFHASLLPQPLSLLLARLLGLDSYFKNEILVIRPGVYKIFNLPIVG